MRVAPRGASLYLLPLLWTARSGILLGHKPVATDRNRPQAAATTAACLERLRNLHAAAFSDGQGERFADYSDGWA